ncbi:MAG: nucleotidyltransferase domain-containing protein [Planctomycetota bacterium]|nr:nucleotidyltransferase domain-containing protein [Planctomycetaceae bacterium]MDQ3330698.1 nucleotidyltransferase domain-containing protein [Planctomycetota bacterium]
MQAVAAVTDDQLEAITKAIRCASDPVGVVLFGSQVSGRVDRDSDIDLLIVEQEPFSRHRSRRKRIADIRRRLPKIGIPYDVLLYATEEVDRWRDARNHVIARALREGRVLYGEGA